MALSDARIADIAARLLEAPEAEVREVLRELPAAEIEHLAQAMADPELVAWVKQRRYLADPTGWARDIVRMQLYSVQKRIAESVRDNRYTAVPSCFGSGKSAVAGRAIIPWWISVHPPGSATVVSTAPTGDQVRAILWKEVNIAHGAGALVGRVNLAQWYIGNLLVGMGRKPSNTNPAAFQGIHAEHLLVVIDEADAVGALLWEAVDHLVVNKASRVLAIGNPLTGSGPFFRACQAGSRWNVIRVSAFETPEFTGEPVPDGWAGVSKTWVEERRQEYGPGYESDPRWQAKVMAVAPEDKAQGVIRLSALRAAAQPFFDDEDREKWWRGVKDETPVQVGIDVGASEGGDQTVARERRGDTLGRVRHWRIRDHIELADRHVIPFLVETGATRVVVDKAGIGHGLADYLDAAQRRGIHRAQVDRFDAGKAGRKKTATHPGFSKARDQIWWEIGRGLLDAGAVDLRQLGFEPGGEAVMVELAEHEWGMDDQGRIKIEKKDDIKERLGHSPDDADAVLLSLWDPPDVARPVAPRSQARSNPYSSSLT